MQDSFYIQLIQKGLELGEFKEEVIKEGISSSEKEVVQALIKNAEVNFHQPATSNAETPFLRVGKSNEEARFRISYDASFKYYDYLELKESRLASKEAKVYAIKSIKLAEKAFWLTLAALFFSIIFSLMQVFYTQKQIEGCQWLEKTVNYFV